MYVYYSHFQQKKLKKKKKVKEEVKEEEEEEKSLSLGQTDSFASFRDQKITFFFEPKSNTKIHNTKTILEA